MTRSKLPWISVVALLAAMGASVSVSMAAFDGSPSSVPIPQHTAQNPAPTATPGKGTPAIDSAQTTAFAAFRRPQTATDRSLIANAQALQALGRAQSESQANPSLARSVYAGTTGSVYLIPGVGKVCAVSVSSTDGVSASCTDTGDAGQEGMGFVQFSSESDAVTFSGVLPDGAHDLKVIDEAGLTTDVPLSADQGYWVTVPHPVDMVWTAADGTSQQAAFGRYKMYRLLSGS